MGDVEPLTRERLQKRFPLIPALARLLNRLFPERQTILTRYIPNTTPQVPEAAIAALRKEVLNQLSLSIRYIAARYGIGPRPKAPSAGQYGKGSKPGNVLTYADLGRLHAEIFAFYARVQAYELDEQEAVQLEAVIRSSRSTMNATRNFYELLNEVEDIGRDDNPFMLEAYRHFKDRLEKLWGMVEKVTQPAEGEAATDGLDRFFESVEEADRRFILSCSSSVAGGIIREHEVTRLLMANRLFTQSCRMLVLSMQALIKGFDPAMGTVKEDSVSP